MKQMNDAASFSECMSWSMHAKRVTWRRFGMHGEYRRPMVHRFEVKGGDTLVSAMAENITRSNALFARLSKRGR